MTLRGTALALLALAPAATAVELSCGSRTELPVPDSIPVAPVDDASIFTASLPDGRALPIIDANPSTDAPPPFCDDAAATLVYVVTQSEQLLRFDPSNATFTVLGTLDCPDERTPFSMAVDHQGVAYVLYATGEVGVRERGGSVYRVSLATAACATTSFVPQTDDFSSFGMGFTTDDSDAGEGLYVASDDPAGLGGDLGVVSTTSFQLSTIGEFNPPVVRGELSGTGDGRLFAFYATDAGSAIGQIDTTNASLIAEDALPQVDQGDAWAFAFWGGDFYLFTAPGGSSSVVTRFRPSDGSVTQVATYPDLIVGAGVSTCAPQQ